MYPYFSSKRHPCHHASSSSCETKDFRDWEFWTPPQLLSRMGLSLKPTNQHETFIHQEEPEDLMDTSSLSVEDIKIKKEQERANCYGFDVSILIEEEENIRVYWHSSFKWYRLSLIIFFPQDDSDSDWRWSQTSSYWKKACVICETENLTSRIMN